MAERCETCGAHWCECGTESAELAESRPRQFDAEADAERAEARLAAMAAEAREAMRRARAEAVAAERRTDTARAALAAAFAAVHRCEQRECDAVREERNGIPNGESLLVAARDRVAEAVAEAERRALVLRNAEADLTEAAGRLRAATVDARDRLAEARAYWRMSAEAEARTRGAVAPLPLGGWLAEWLAGRSGTFRGESPTHAEARLAARLADAMDSEAADAERLAAGAEAERDRANWSASATLAREAATAARWLSQTMRAEARAAWRMSANAYAAAADIATAEDAARRRTREAVAALARAYGAAVPNG